MSPMCIPHSNPSLCIIIIGSYWQHVVCEHILWCAYSLSFTCDRHSSNCCANSVSLVRYSHIRMFEINGHCLRLMTGNLIAFHILENNPKQSHAQTRFTCVCVSKGTPNSPQESTCGNYAPTWAVVSFILNILPHASKNPWTCFLSVNLLNDTQSVSTSAMSLTITTQWFSGSLRYAKHSLQRVVFFSRNPEAISRVLARWTSIVRPSSCALNNPPRCIRREIDSSYMINSGCCRMLCQQQAVTQSLPV